METSGSNNSNETKAKLDYLKELLTDRAVLSNYPGIYLHVGKILDKEILKVRSALFATYGIYSISDKDLPDPEGPKVNLVNRVYMPAGENSSFNFVGRILGPDGSTAKCLQQCLGVKIMVRGRGSMRDRKKEEANIGKPNWEHLNDKLHVVLTVEDYENRAQARLDKASEYISLFLKESLKASDRDDKVKQMQLMELSLRREPRVAWPMNYCGMFNFGLPPKPGTIFPNPNVMSFGYGYPHPAGPPPPPANALFSSLHPNPNPHHHHHHHHGHPTGPPPPAAAGPTPAPASFGHIPASHQQNLAATQGHGAPLGTLTHSFASAVSPNLSATVLVGPPGPTGPYTNSHLTPVSNPTCNGGIAAGQSGPTAPQAPPPSIPGALAMASMNYWSNAPSGLAHVPATDFSVQTHLSAGNNAPSGVNGFSTGNEQSSSDEFSNSTHLNNGSHPTGLCNVLMSAHSASHAISRVNEDPMTGTLLPEFVTCVGVKDSNTVNDGRVTAGLSGLYAPTATAGPVSPNASTLKLPSSSLHSGSPPPPSATAATTSSTTPAPPSSSFAAKQGLKTRYNAKGNYPTSQIHSAAGGRSARNTVVAVRVGLQEKTNEVTSNANQSTFEVRGKSDSKLDDRTMKSEKKFTASHAAIKTPGKNKTMESRWHDMESAESIVKDRKSTSGNSSMDPIEQGMLDLSLISDANGQAPDDRKVSSTTLDGAK